MAQKKRKRRRGGDRSKKKGGALIGMRRGFKKAASTVGVGADGKPAGAEAASKKSWLSNAFTVLLVLAAAAMLYYRFFRSS